MCPSTDENISPAYKQDSRYVSFEGVHPWLKLGVLITQVV